MLRKILLLLAAIGITAGCGPTGNPSQTDGGGSDHGQGYLGAPQRPPEKGWRLFNGPLQVPLQPPTGVTSGTGATSR